MKYETGGAGPPAPITLRNGPQSLRDNGERLYIICDGLYPESRPWVLAETIDEAWARDEANTWTTTVVLAREEALRTPRYRDAVRDWEAGKDKQYRQDMEREDAEAKFDNLPVDLDPDDVLAEECPAPPAILTFEEFRRLPREAGRSEAHSRAAYFDYLRLEADWHRTVDDTAAGQ